MAERHHAPGHHVTHLLGVAAAAPTCADNPGRVEAWQANLRRIADQMWHEAWHAGAPRGLAMQAEGTRYIVVTDDQYRRIVGAIDTTGGSQLSLDELAQAARSRTT